MALGGHRMADNRIGFIGAGKIGEPMVERLLTAGHQTTVHARRPEVRARLADAGAAVTGTADDVGDADIVIACVFDDSQLAEVATPIIARMSAGSVFVSHTTGNPRTILDLSAAARRRGVAVVDAPFSGTPEDIRKGKLTVLLGGEDDAVDRVEAIVGAYASTLHRIGPTGTALAAKLINNALFAACTQITLSALAAGRELGIPQAALLDLLADTSGGSTAAGYIARSGHDAETYGRRVGRYLTKDLDVARIAATDLGVDIEDLLAAARLGPIDLGEPTPQVRSS
nr:NAD(P)-dependent oxidoreductase [Gordonia soli]